MKQTASPITQTLSKPSIILEGVTYRIDGPMRLSRNLRPMAAIQVRLFSGETTELSVEAYLHQQFELGCGDKSRVLETLKVRWEGDKSPVSWVSWKYQKRGNRVAIYLAGPCSTYGTITATL